MCSGPTIPSIKPGNGKINTGRRPNDKPAAPPPEINVTLRDMLDKALAMSDTARGIAGIPKSPSAQPLSGLALPLVNPTGVPQLKNPTSSRYRIPKKGG